MDTSVAIEWMRDGMALDNSTNRVIASVVENGNTYFSTITFSPINTTDSGTYECTGTVDTDIMNDNIISSTNNGQLSVTVQGNEKEIIFILNHIFPTRYSRCCCDTLS